MPEPTGDVVIGGTAEIPEAGVVEVMLDLVACPLGELMAVPVEPVQVVVEFPIGKGAAVDDVSVPGEGLLKPVPEMNWLVEVEELKKPDISVLAGDVIDDPGGAEVIPLEDGTSGAVPVGVAEKVMLGNGNGGATVEVASSLPLPFILGDSELAVVSDPVMVLETETVPNERLVVALPRGYGV